MEDQASSCKRGAAERDLDVVETYIEPGASGRDENRPVLQKMLDDATQRPRPFEVVMVHSWSRLFRDQVQLELLLRKLKKLGIQVISITQDLPDNSTGELVRRVIGLMDELFSEENAKHVLRTMRANAAQGFWNGARAPLGYHTVVVGRQGEKEKKALAPLEEEAVVVRTIFNLCQGVDGVPHGVKAIASYLNENGVLHRGKKFSTSNVYDVLTRPVYHGTHYWYTRNSRTGKMHDRSEWIASTVTPLISSEQFDRCQALLKARSPKVTPPRIVNGPTLLSALAKCASCGCGLTVSTGKGGRYHYYACAGRALKGETVCQGRRYPQELLDNHILDHLSAHLLSPDRLTKILHGFLDHSEQAEAARKAKIGRLRAERTEAEAGINNILLSVEKALFDFGDEHLRAHLERLRSKIRAKTEEINALEASRVESRTAITPERLARFGDALHNALRTGDRKLRRLYLQMFVERIEVYDHEIRITGSRLALVRGASSEATLWGAEIVPSFVRKWCAATGEDENYVYAIAL